MVRYYKGKIPIEMILIGKPNSLVKSLGFGTMGQKTLCKKIVNMFKQTYPGELNICRTRDCWLNEKKPKEVKN